MQVHASDTAAFHEMTSEIVVSANDHRKRALIALENGFSDPEFGVSRWAEETGFQSRRHLERTVKATTGHTPEELLWKRRVLEGDMLLRSDSGKLTVSEVSYRVGFKEQSHFSRKYKELLGISPSEARNQTHGHTAPSQFGKR
jgi:AraC-like DNA-binding protein